MTTTPRYTANTLPSGTWYVYDAQTDSIVEYRTDRTEADAKTVAAALEASR